MAAASKPPVSDQIAAAIISRASDAPPGVWRRCQMTIDTVETMPAINNRAMEYGVKVHIISRLTPMGFDARGMEMMPALLRGAYQAGMDGFNIYETMNVMEMNPLGISITKGFADPAIRLGIKQVRQLADQSSTVMRAR